VVLPAILGIAFALVLYQALRRPLLRRLAVRDASRRPRETALVIAGSLLGTALITGSFIVGDTLDSSIKATAYTQLGPVDEVVRAPSRDIGVELLENLRAAEDPNIDGLLSMELAQSAFVSEASGKKLAEPGGQMIELDFEEGREFGNDPVIAGISGPTPSEGEAVITQDLADEVDAGAGDDITAYLYGKKVDLTVDRVLPTVGLAGVWFGFQSVSPNAFVAPGTLQEVAKGNDQPGVVPPTTAIAISNKGGVEPGADLTEQVTQTIEEAFPTDASLRVETVKLDSLETAEEQGNQFSELFISIGSFAIIAGILLLVNIFVMLAEERKGQLGMLRAVGMRRGFLVRTFVIEGAMYSLASSILGAALGIGVGWAIVKLAAPIFGAFGDFSLDLRFDFEVSSIVSGFCSGALISLVTVLFTSLRISRINIISAIRDLQEPPKGEAKTRTVVLGIVLFAISTASFIGSFGDPQAWVVSILGPPIGLLGLLPWMSRVIARRTAVLIVSAFSLAWGIFGNVLTGGSFFEGGDIFAFVVQGVLLTFSAVMLLTQALETLEGGIRRVAARRLPLRLSVAYPLARRFRTGLTLGMFALVIFTMTFIAILSNVFGGQVADTAAKEGDFEILMVSNDTNPPVADQIREVEGVEDVSSLATGIALFQPDGFDEPEPWQISAIDESFVAGGPPNITEFSERFESEDEAWQAVVDDPTNIIVPTFFLQEGGGGPAAQVVELDDTLTVVDPVTGEEVERTIVALNENDFAFSGAYVSKPSLREAIGDRAATSRFYVEATEDPAEADEVANVLEGRFVENGVRAQTFRSLIEEFSRANLQFLRLMQGYLALGLLVGIAGLGVVMVRAVRERRRDVGVLRSLGFGIKQVRRAFVLESGFVAFEGILVGAVLAIITASQLVATGEFGEDIQFQIPWGNLAVLTIGSLIASILATAWPAQEASKIPPAAALRIAD
jgi:putative ABC transport system permease protein